MPDLPPAPGLPGAPAVPVQPVRTPYPASSRAQTLFWLALAVAVCLGFALRASRPALSNALVVHDDVRQHVFWVPRLHDPSLFAGDWIAEYYESQAPQGYRAFYWLLTVGLDAIWASKLLPLGLTVVLAVATFQLGWALWQRSDVAALGAVLLGWIVWQYDDVASATPRAYALPLLAIQLGALAAGRWRLALAILPLQALFYPLGCAPAVLTLGAWTLWRAFDAASSRPGCQAAGAADVSQGVAAVVGEGGASASSVAHPPRNGVATDVAGGTLRGWSVKPLLRSLPIRTLVELAGATVIALLIVAHGQLDAARFGPAVTAAAAREMPEFQPGGRTSYFVPGWYQFWLESSRSGFALGPRDPVLEDVPAMAIPFALSLVLGGWLLAGWRGWTTPPRVPKAGVLLLVLLGCSLLLFFAAHLLLFVLYLPARHVQFSLPLVWALAGGLCWTLLGERLAAGLGAQFRSAGGQADEASPDTRTGVLAKTGLTGAELFTLVGIGVLALHPPPTGDFYVTGRHPAIYAYLRQTPPDTFVGALPADSSILPLFGQRGVLTSYEHSLPYHPGYYQPLHDRTEAFRVAYYAPTLAPLARVIAEQGIDLVIADTEMLERRRRAEREQPPALEEVLDRCGVLHERELVVVPATCILEAEQEEATASTRPR